MNGRILGIDYGRARVGIAVTDPLQIITSGLDRVAQKDFLTFILQYCRTEKVVKIVFGKPLHTDGNPTFLWKDITTMSDKIKKEFPNLEIDYIDESFTSVDAKAILLQSAKKNKRRDKKSIDKISAILILQKYLGHI